MGECKQRLVGLEERRSMCDRKNVCESWKGRVQIYLRHFSLPPTVYPGPGHFEFTMEGEIY